MSEEQPTSPSQLRSNSSDRLISPIEVPASPGFARKLAPKQQPAPGQAVKAGTAVGTHTISDAERRSYIDFINKSLKPGKDARLDKLLAALGLPIDPEDELSLFTTMAKGLLLATLLGYNFPEYISINKFNIKAHSPFEININHDMTLDAARQLGCQIVNVGATDLSSGTPHLCLGVLWQIIKKALLKNVSLLNPALNGLFNEEGVDFSKLAPDQIVMQWINHHLHKAGSDRRVKNFQSDIQDSHSYLILLSQIGKEAGVTQEEIDILRGNADPVARATGVCEIAQRILGPDATLFVTPNEIVNPNPRLNLAFAATLFNKFPNIGPSNDELMSMENKIRSLEEERTQLMSKLESARHFEEENRILKERLANEIAEKEAIKTRLDEVEIQAKSFFEGQQGAAEQAAAFAHELAELRKRIHELEQRISELTAQLATAQEVDLPQKQAELDRLAAEKAEQAAQFALEKEGLMANVDHILQQLHSASSQAMSAAELAAQKEREIEAANQMLEFTASQAQQETEFLKQSLAQKAAEAEHLAATVQQQVQQQAALIAQRDREMAEYRAQQEAEMARLKEEHAAKLAAFAKQQDMQLQALKTASQKQKEKLSSEFETQKQDILQKSQQEVLERETTIQQTIVKLQNVESGSSQEITELKKRIEELMATNTERKIEIERLKGVVTQLQDLLPGGSVKEGMLTKKSGSGNRWQQRFFVLKTNFMTYYKDQKPASLKHPAGVIDLQKCGISKFDASLYPDIKLPKGGEAAIMVLNSEGRKYFIQAADERERDEWVRAVEQATSMVQKTISAKTTQTSF